MACRFCEIIKEGNLIIYQDDLVVTFFDHDPISKGHLLVVPKEHSPDLDDLPEAISNRMLEVSKKYIGILREKWDSAGFSIMINGGQFNDVGHCHFHVFPRNNKKEFSWTYQEIDVAELLVDDTAKQFVQKTLELEMGLRPIDFPTLETARLVLDCLKAEDIPTIVQLVGNENVSKTTLGIPYPYNQEDAKHWIMICNRGYASHDKITFALRSKTNLQLMGSVGLILNKRFDRASLGYWLGEPYWNQGFITEAVGALIEYGFSELSLNKIFAQHEPENPASGKVMQKCGMLQEGTLIQHTKKEGVYRDIIQYGITKEAFCLRKDK